MPPKDNKTVRAWRLGFTVIYVLFTAAATTVALLSVLAVHCGWTRPAAIKGPRISPSVRAGELRVCHARLSRLLSELHDKTFELQAKALKYKTDPAMEWRNWSAAWRGRWEGLDYRCRLGELSDTGVSPEIDRMKAIHTALAELQLSYSEVVNRFVERYAGRLRELRRELSTVRSMIERRAAKRPNKHSS